MPECRALGTGGVPRGGATDGRLSFSLSLRRHAIIFWNEHSFLFEVAWCVMLYFAVTIIELTPVILERFPYPRRGKRRWGWSPPRSPPRPDSC